ncbi:hypothetical protein H9Q13_04770 [Pontibacter sp. JH31]|uniref:Uncharacterized protein n=1 Tax=Pontibacter aquaedesilientis TaxID=2766980 RepID=A0ABR7XDU3_9BACT|nr:hypothetical protein [Pontibacter aquaedesilientis]MBD1396468.1 hypothetical protein [Pontibacter aquaedesilientis]
MKKQFYLLTFFLPLALLGCQQSDDAQGMLQNENERQKVYNTILENEEMRNELMAVMRERNMGEGMMGQRGMMQGGGMVGDTSGMAGMHQQMQAQMKQMMQLCETDSAACSNMTRMMLANRALMGNMMQQMRKGGMEQGCLQQMMRQLEPKQ